MDIYNSSDYYKINILDYGIKELQMKKRNVLLLILGVTVTGSMLFKFLRRDVRKQELICDENMFIPASFEETDDSKKYTASVLNTGVSCPKFGLAVRYAVTKAAEKTSTSVSDWIVVEQSVKDNEMCVLVCGSKYTVRVLFENVRGTVYLRYYA